MAEKLLFAASVDEALRLKDADSAFLAGGTEINRLDSLVNAGTLIDIRKIQDLKEIRKDADLVWYGAAVSFQEAVEYPDTPAWFKEACLLMASRTKRNMASIGGNVALLRDDSYIVPALLAGRSKVVYAEKDGKEETVCICRYLESRRNGELADALILRIGIDASRKVQIKRYANTAMSHSVLNVSYGTDKDGKNISIAAAVKNGGLYFLKPLSEKIENNPSISEEEIADTVKNCKGSCMQIVSDMFGSEEYKRYLLGVTIARMAMDAR